MPIEFSPLESKMQGVVEMHPDFHLAASQAWIGGFLDLEDPGLPSNRVVVLHSPFFSFAEDVRKLELPSELPVDVRLRRRLLSEFAVVFGKEVR